MELYHNALSTCSQKVRLVLAEKGLDFESHEIDLIAGGQHEPEYVKLNPAHQVPTLVHEGTVLVESSRIIRYLDDAFPEPPLRGPGALDRYASDVWLDHIDRQIHPVAPIVTFALGPRRALLAQPREVREANLSAIPDPVARAERRSVLERGFEAPEFAEALGRFLGLLHRMETALAERPWLDLPGPGLADATALPYVLRLEHLGLDPLLSDDRWPRVADWLARWKSRPGFEIAVGQWVVPAIVEMLRKEGSALWPRLRPIVDAYEAGR